jgi:hypothetical protein
LRAVREPTLDLSLPCRQRPSYVAIHPKSPPMVSQVGLADPWNTGLFGFDPLQNASRRSALLGLVQFVPLGSSNNRSARCRLGPLT